MFDTRAIAVLATGLLITPIFLSSSSFGNMVASARISNAHLPLKKNGQEKQDDCDLDALRKQLESLKEKEDNFNKAVRDLLKERDKLKQLMDKRIEGFRDQLSPEEKVEFDKALKEYNKAVDAYDVALSNANADIADGVDAKKANKDAGVQGKKDDMSKALEEMFKPMEAEQKKQDVIDKKQALKEKQEEGVKKAQDAAKGETDGEEAPKPPKAPKPPNKAQIMKGLKTNLEGLNDAFDKVQGQLRGLGVKLKEGEKEKKELQKKLKEAEDKCLEPVASGAPTFTAPGYDVKIVLENGLLRIHDTTPFGVITTNLPADLKPDEKFSGTNYLDPAGKTNAEREKNIAKLKEHNVSIGGRDITNWTGMIGSDFLPYSGQFASYRDLDYGVVFEGKPVIGTRLPNSLPPPPQPTSYVLPTGAQQGGFITIPGPFDGVVSPTDSCTIGGSKIPILAESPHSRVVWNTSQTPGPSTIAVGENGQTGTCPFNNVSVKLSAPNLHLLRGQTTVLTVVVSGLDGLKQEVPFELVNHSLGVVSMDGGNKQSAIIRPSDLQSDGTYRTTRTLRGVAPGSFNITATVIWKETCKPSMEVMRLQKSATVTDAGSR